MKQTQCDHPSIVHECTLQEGRSGDLLKRIQVAITLGQEPTGEAREKPPYGIKGHVNRCGIPEDTRVGDHRKKLVGTGPRNANRFRRSDCLRQHLSSTLMEGLLAMRADEQVCVDSDHAPCPR